MASRMVPVQMGSYGIGPTRLVAGIIEASHDDNGIIWPERWRRSASGIVNMRVGDADATRPAAISTAARMPLRRSRCIDDTDERAGAKFAPWI
jgi:prolyl-tRNA synthetase